MSERVRYGIVGLGLTGLSCAQFFKSKGIPFTVFDTRDNPPNLDKFKEEFPEVIVHTGNNWSDELFEHIKTLVVSPGVSVQTPFLQAAEQKGIEIIGDIELFIRAQMAPIIAITGANGKSTVTTLLGEMAKAAGKRTAVVGNIGTPVLNLLTSDSIGYDLIIMELSSFQLETTYSLKALAATVLNITPDHMDRYQHFDNYVQAKHRIFNQAQNVVINLQDPLSDSDQITPTATRKYFTLATPVDPNTYGLKEIEGKTWLMKGQEKLIASDQIKLVGKHNLANILSALALGEVAGLDQKAMLETLKTFSGLAHRTQVIATKDGVTWINDSKGTNIGACVAALKGLGESIKGKIVIILGGEGKGADFTELSPLIKQYCRSMILMGKDANLIGENLQQAAPFTKVTNMQEAVTAAHLAALPGDVVLLSPACASLDQYRDFNHRGEVFMEMVNKVLSLHAPIN